MAPPPPTGKAQRCSNTLIANQVPTCSWQFCNRTSASGPSSARPSGANTLTSSAAPKGPAVKGELGNGWLVCWFRDARVLIGMTQLGCAAIGTPTVTTKQQACAPGALCQLSPAHQVFQTLALRQQLSSDLSKEGNSNHILVSSQGRRASRAVAGFWQRTAAEARRAACPLLPYRQLTGPAWHPSSNVMLMHRLLHPIRGNLRSSRQHIRTT